MVPDDSTHPPEGGVFIPAARLSCDLSDLRRDLPEWDWAVVILTQVSPPPGGRGRRNQPTLTLLGLMPLFLPFSDFNHNVSRILKLDKVRTLKPHGIPKLDQARTSHQMPHPNPSRPDAITLAQR